MGNFQKSMICKTCGTGYNPSVKTPDLCQICTDDRQYIPEGGQKWIETSELKHNYKTEILQISENLYSLKISPGFALSNRAFLVTTPEGNVLWDCIPLLDQETIDFIQSIGGLKAIAFSHPHYYSNMNEWAKVFNCRIYIHEADSQYIVFQSKHIRLWQGANLSLSGGIKIVHTGGHFPGSCILYLPFLSPQGTVLCGDSLYLSRSKKHLSVMYSYPNHILLHKDEFVLFEQKVQPVVFDTIYGAFEHQNLEGNAMEVYQASMQRARLAYGL